MTIDIMMPFYGDPGQFRLAVESVLQQSDPDWRLVVVDDRYPDDEPGRWLVGIADERITYILNDANLGVSGNFSKCLELVEASHFVLMGCDDHLEPNYVEVMADYIDQFPDASYFQPDVTVMDQSGSPSLPLADRVKRWYRPRLRSAFDMLGESLAVSLLRGNWTYFPSICWRTDVVRQFGFRTDFDVVLDLALQLHIVEGGGSMVLLPETLFRYRRHENSVSSWTARDGSRFNEERRFFLDQASTLRELHWFRARRVALNHLSSRLNAATKLPSALRSGDKSGGIELFRHFVAGWTEQSTEPA